MTTCHVTQEAIEVDWTRQKLKEKRMSEKINDGGPAFPCPVSASPSGDAYEVAYEGMTLRDWLAGQALAAMLPPEIHTYGYSAPEKFVNGTAALAYQLADAMIRERSK